MAGFFRRNGFVLASLALAGTMGVVALTTHAGLDAGADARETEQKQVAAQLLEAGTAASELRDEVAAEASGADVARLAEDRVAIGQLLDAALTWSSHAEYVEARESTMRVGGLAEDSSLMQAFLPPAPVNTDADGNEYPYIDAAGLNSRVGSFHPRLLSVAGTEYSYLVLVNVQSTSTDGNATATRAATVLVTVDDQGALSDVRGYASTSETKRGGGF